METQQQPVNLESPDGKYRILEYSLPSNNPTVNEYNGFVIMESSYDIREAPKAIRALNDSAARKFALSFASTNGLTNPGVNGVPTPYAVDEAGQPVTDPRRQTAVGYRLRVNVSRGLR